MRFSIGAPTLLCFLMATLITFAVDATPPIPRYTEFESRFHWYCQSGNLSNVERVAGEKGVSYVVNSYWVYGREHDTCLSFACKGGHEELVAFLLENGDDPNEHPGVWPDNWSVLRLAYRSRNLAVVKKLLDAGARVNATKDNYLGRSYPIFWAVNDGNVKAAQMFIDAGADVNVKDHHKDSTVQRAVGLKHYDMARFLQGAGAFWACAGKRNGEHLADPDNCCGYMRCSWPGTNFEAEQKRRCSRNTAWNEEKQLCDVNVDCGSRNNDCMDK